MKKVYQTRLTAKDGNCFVACIASILELPIEEIDFDSGNSKNVRDWMEEEMNPVLEKLGYLYVEFPFGNGLHFFPENTLMIASGTSPRFPEVQHSVVVRLEYKDKKDFAKGYDLIVEHDPMPNSREAIKDVKWVGFLVERRLHIK